MELVEGNRQRHPRNVEAASTYGWVLHKLGRLDDAVREQRLAIRYAPNEVEILMNLERFEAAARQPLK